ncbi:DivIVA domain-containing protein [Solihabitans fulvus]|uniref:Cell wall synthesis protein Wag31 n=1 Tax=Solihabitans fulvus TaxID=1892852 RepID=A0A5B2WQW3_9PSEU|nr:DivIVA domain-containing protein [Solihabitans fulvus]KAA2252916.1 DivIVA domain-containing protein [Solihabitans fulvus]
MSVSPDEVRDIAFSRPSLGKRGYREAEVDAFLERVEATLRGTDDLTPKDVRDVVFSKPPIGQRGYNEGEVDEFLDRVEETLAELSP